jgi:hypothetical protein
MRFSLAAKWTSAAALFALSMTAATAEALYPANQGNEQIQGRVEVFSLSNTRLPASSVYRCTNRGCDFVKLSIAVKPPETQIIQFQETRRRRGFRGYSTLPAGDYPVLGY